VIDADRGEAGSAGPGAPAAHPGAGGLGDLDRIEAWVHVFGMVNSAEGFDRQPAVINGFSDLILELFGDAGAHAGSAVGMAALPFNLPVEVEAEVLVRR
jgi:enamine deaminase RidA (YjgF/YER057c/UK114 family)